jgi:dephospho-CoA kinase
MCVVIGITGGIASGKTTLAKRLAARGYAYFNADECVHWLYKTDTVLLTHIAARFADVWDGKTFYRAKLAAHIARDASLFTWLEGLVHPRVRAAEARAIARAVKQRRRGIILDIPLLFETGADAQCDMVITMQASPLLQRRRALARGMNEETLARVMARQYTDDVRAQLADAVIHTGLGKAVAWRQLQRVLKGLGIHA